MSGAGIDYIPILSEFHDYSVSNIIRLVRQKKVDAFLVLDSQVTTEEWKFLRKYHIPFIQLHYKPVFSSTEDIHYIFSDNFAGGQLATENLIEHGCKKIMCIAIKSVHSEILDRTEGYLATLRDNNLPIDKNLIIEDECSFFNGERLVLENHDLLKKVDGIFVHADIMALGAIKGLASLGYSVPKDIRIVGYDDIKMGTYYNPTLTTIHQPKEELAEKACKKLTDLLGKIDGDLMQEVIQPRLISRESC